MLQGTGAAVVEGGGIRVPVPAGCVCEDQGSQPGWLMLMGPPPGQIWLLDFITRHAGASYLKGLMVMFFASSCLK